MSLPHPQQVRPPAHRRFHRWRRALQTGASILLLLAPFLGLLRVDLQGPGLVLLGMSLSPQELAPVFGLLILGMLAIFAGALIYGRLWCGWACPQTVLSEASAAIERKVFGRGRPSTARRALAVGLQLTLAALVAASLVSYCLPPDRWLSPPLAAWIGWAIGTALIGVDVLVLRHRVCVGICPYGVLQGVVQDARTLRVELDPARTGECVDCRACVRACFMGVDLRHPRGTLACVSCGDCIDAALGSRVCPDGLLRFTIPRAGSTWPQRLLRLGIADGRRAVIALVLPSLALGLGALLWLRDPLEMRITPRYEQARLDEQGQVDNAYSLTLGNRSGQPVTLALSAAGVEGLALPDGQASVVLAARERRRIDVHLTAPQGSLTSGAHPITLRVTPPGAQPQERPTSFFVPRRKRP